MLVNLEEAFPKSFHVLPTLFCVSKSKDKGYRLILLNGMLFISLVADKTKLKRFMLMTGTLKFTPGLYGPRPHLS